MLRNEIREFVEEILFKAPNDSGGQTPLEYQYRLFLTSANSSLRLFDAYWMLRDAEFYSEAAILARSLLESLFTVNAATSSAEVATEIIAADVVKLIRNNEKWIDSDPAVEEGIAGAQAVRRESVEHFKALLGRDTIGQFGAKTCAEIDGDPGTSAGDGSSSAFLPYYYSLYADLCGYSHGNYALQIDPRSEPHGAADFIAAVAPLHIAYRVAALGGLPEGDLKARILSLHRRSHSEILLAGD